MKDKKAYLVFDVSGSVSDQAKKAYKKIMDHYSKDYECEYIVHTVIGKEVSSKYEVFSSMLGGSHASSGLKIALAKAILNKNNKDIIVYAGDGGNWTDDNERVYSILNLMHQLGIKFIYHEVFPEIHSSCLSTNFVHNRHAIGACVETYIINENTDIFGEPIEQKQKYIVYMIEHAVGGKKYSFISTDSLKIGDIVLCDTTQGATYGKVVDVELVELTEKKYKKLKSVKKL